MTSENAIDPCAVPACALSFHIVMLGSSHYTSVQLSNHIVVPGKLRRGSYHQQICLFAGLGRAGAAAETDAIAPALHKIERAAIAASTQITYPPAELLMLVEDHLRASGLHASADMLTQEADLPRLPADGQARLAADAPAEPRDMAEQPKSPFLTFSSQRECPVPVSQPSRGESNRAFHLPRM